MRSRNKRDRAFGLLILLGGSAVLWAMVYVLCSLVYHYPVLAVLCVISITICVLIVQEDMTIKGIGKARKELDDE